MLNDWYLLSDDLQLVVSGEAMKTAMLTVAGQADALAKAMAAGVLVDRGGVDALHLLAAVMRLTSEDGQGPSGRA